MKTPLFAAILLLVVALPAGARIRELPPAPPPADSAIAAILGPGARAGARISADSAAAPGLGAWSEIPANRLASHSAAFDPLRHRMLVFGGMGRHSVYSNEVWQLDFSPRFEWRRLATVGTPPTPRVMQKMIYDPVRDRLVIFGGYDGNYLNDSWELSLAGSPTWTRLQPAGTPPLPRAAHSAVYDPGLDAMVVFGGLNPAQTRLNDVCLLRFSGSLRWELPPTPAVAPHPRLLHSAIYDEAHARVIVFGGLDVYNDYVNDTWALSVGDGIQWTQLAPGGTPPNPRGGHGAIYDPSRGRMLIFGGGAVANEIYDDIVELTLGDAPAWRTIDTIRPGVRRNHSLVYDPDSNRAVAFGGQGWYSDIYNDVWYFSLDNDLGWTKTYFQPVRVLHAAALDPVHRQLLFFGGVQGPEQEDGYDSGPEFDQNDLWAMDLEGDQQWSRLETTNPPPPRRMASLVYDPVGARLVLFGGLGTGPLDDTWVLPLSAPLTWQLLDCSGGPPPPRGGHSAVYDPIRRRMIVCGGTSSFPYMAALNDVWELSLDGAPGWREILPDTTPAPWPCAGHSAVYDSLRDRMLVFGGMYFPDRNALGAMTNDLLAMSAEGEWSLVDTHGSTLPPVRAFQSAVYDSRADRLIVYGGFSSELLSQVCLDAWEFGLAAGTWRHLTGPEDAEDNLFGRWGHVAIYDAATNRMVVHGGNGGGNRVYTDGCYQRGTWQLAWPRSTVGVEVALGGARAEPGRVWLSWYCARSAGRIGAVERRTVDGPWRQVAEISVDGAGYAEYEDADVSPGARYGYRLCLEDQGQCSEEVWLDVPWTAGLALGGFSPNPSRGPMAVGFSLPDRGPARLELMDVSGRRVLRRDLDDLGPGNHVLPLGAGAGLAPGVYLLRLTHGGVSLTKRGVLVR